MANKHEHSPVALMAASQFYRVLLERTFNRESSAEDLVPLTTVMLSGSKFQQPAESHEA